jgi:hypothetical protein
MNLYAQNLKCSAFYRLYLKSSVFYDLVCFIDAPTQSGIASSYGLTSICPSTTIFRYSFLRNKWYSIYKQNTKCKYITWVLVWLNKFDENDITFAIPTTFVCWPMTSGFLRSNAPLKSSAWFKQKHVTILWLILQSI